MERYKILFEGGEGELTEKKSRFIATTRPVESEEEAVAFIDEMKKNTGMPDTTARLMSLASADRCSAAVMTASRPRPRAARC